MEHTVVESYPQQIHEREIVRRMFPLGGPELVGVDDACQYRLLLRPGSLAPVARREQRDLAAEIAFWAQVAVSKAPWPHRPGTPTFYAGYVGSVRLEVGLERWTDSIGCIGPLARVIQVGFWRTDELEVHRAVRVRKALDDKVSKLLTAAPGSRTVLVVEDRDLAMGSPRAISEALAEVCVGPLPDAVYHLAVKGADPVATRLYESGRWWHEMGGPLISFDSETSATFNRLRQR